MNYAFLFSYPRTESGTQIVVRALGASPAGMGRAMTTAQPVAVRTPFPRDLAPPAGAIVPGPSATMSSTGCGRGPTRRLPAAAVEAQFAGIVTELKRILTIPIAVKVSPYFTAFGNMARQLDAAGADGLVLFNRFYQADIDIKTLKAAAHVELSASGELLLRLRWLAIL